MLSMKQVLCEMEASVTRLDLCREERRYIDMPYLIGRLSGYNELLQDFVNAKLCKSAESSKGENHEL